MAKITAEMVVESAHMELPDTKTLKLKWPEGYDVEFKTGQFITVTGRQDGDATGGLGESGRQAGGDRADGAFSAGI
jgi:ferredoxin-NADP reductase